MSTAIPSPTCFISAPPALGAWSVTVLRHEMKFQRGKALCRRGQGRPGTQIKDPKVHS